ncbi:phospho-acceptor domain-containing protein [Bacteriovorax stolpii]|nr:phospho-acceptor domain-containing protein [Bacteriovorax stolpii]
MKFISPTLSKQSELAKARYVLPFTYCFVALGIYFFLTYYFRYESKILAFSCLAASFAVMFLPFIMKTFKSYLLTANYIILVYFITIEMLTLYTGGIKASSIWWIGIVPVLAAFLLNAFYSIIWFIIIALNIVLISQLKRLDMLPLNVVPAQGMDQFLVTSTVFGIILITALCILADILREKTTSEKEELQNKSFRLTQLASLGNLATGVAHEINNPLSVIKGCQYKIRRMIEGEKPIDKKALESYMDKIERNVKRIQDVTFSMRSISDKSNRKISPINMQELLMSVAAMAKDRVGNRDIQIHTHFKQTELYFSGIYNEIFRAIYIIVENSLDELIDLNRGNGQVEISLDDYGPNMMIFIRDNGRGIPEEFTKNIFDPFFTTKSIGQATGLGLTYSANIITFNGGTLEFIPTPGKGACFKVVLPKQAI